MEIALSRYFNPRKNLIVPNVFWGMFSYEVDLLVVSKSGYATEIEIKVSKQDLIKDKKKRHGHDSYKIKYLYFAIPSYLKDFTEHIPEKAGIIIVSDNYFCQRIRKPRINHQYKFTEQELFKVARLGAIRIWGLKQKILFYKERKIRRRL